MWSCLATSATALLVLITVASYGNQVDLLEKLSHQGSGISLSYSDACVFIFITAQALSSILSANHLVKMTKPLKCCIIGEIMFLPVTVYFHTNPIINVPYLAYFTMIGSFVHFWHAKGVTEFCQDTQVKLAHLQQVKAHFLCLATLPFLLSLWGETGAVGCFVFNGYAIIYSVIGLDPLMREAEKGASSKELMWRLKVARIIHPLAGLSMAVESYVGFDMHVFFHILMYIYTVLMNSLINDTYKKCSE